MKILYKKIFATLDSTNAKSIADQIEAIIKEMDLKLITIKDFQRGDRFLAKRILGMSNYYQAMNILGEVGIFYVLKGSHE